MGSSPFTLGAGSRGHMKGIHPELVAGLELAIQITPIDFSVIDGVRTLDEAKANKAKGVGVVDSLHCVQPDGFGHAFDWKPVGEQSLERFRKCTAAILQAADQLDIPIQVGSDWDGDGVDVAVDHDGPVDRYHAQKPRAYHEKRAREARIRRMGLRASGKEFVI